MDWQVTKGIINMGNTCYLNACLQCLMNMPELVLHIVKYKLQKEDIKHISVIKAFRTLILQYFSTQNKIVNPCCVKQHILSTALKNSRQQEDADECLNDLLNKCVDIFNVKSLFSVNLEQINIDKKNSTSNTELSLYLDIPEGKQNINIISCFQKYLQRYGQNNNNRMYVKSVGAYLCLTLKRFTIRNNKYHKITTPVTPNYLFSIDGKKCKLVSVIIHQGRGLGSGHYISLVLKKCLVYVQ